MNYALKSCQSGATADGSVRQIACCITKDRSQFYKDLAIPFYGANRPGAKVPQGHSTSFRLRGTQASLLNAYKSIKAFSETDFTGNPNKIDAPTLVLHGEDD
jgi:non-heme chloroperoxidase